MLRETRETWEQTYLQQILYHTYSPTKKMKEITLSVHHTHDDKKGTEPRKLGGGCSGYDK